MEITVEHRTARPRPRAPPRSRIGLADDFDSFLQLLTTQLKNQDPLAPMDANQFTQQLVQFSAVEQAIKTNDALGQLLVADARRPDRPQPRLSRRRGRGARARPSVSAAAAPPQVGYRLEQSARAGPDRASTTGRPSGRDPAGPDRRPAATASPGTAASQSGAPLPAGPLSGRGRRERCRRAGGAGHDHHPRRGRRRRDRWRPPHAVGRRRAAAARIRSPRSTARRPSA